MKTRRVTLGYIRKHAIKDCVFILHVYASLSIFILPLPIFTKMHSPDEICLLNCIDCICESQIMYLYATLTNDDCICVCAQRIIFNLTVSLSPAILVTTHYVRQGGRGVPNFSLPGTTHFVK